MADRMQNEEDIILEGEEGLVIGQDYSDVVYPNAKVRVSKDQYTLLHVRRLVEDRKELILSPDFQRDSVWNQRQRSELVESILMGIPLPVIYLFETRNGKKQVVDGRQRIGTVIDFLNDKIRLGDLRILPQFNGLSFSMLPPIMQGIFEDYQLNCYIIQPPTPERVKYDIFDRVNRGGTKLNSQEMRNALYQGHATKFIDEISTSQQFKMVTNKGISPKRMRDRYAVLRSLAFFLLFSQEIGLDEEGKPITYKSDIDDFLAKVMVRINASDESERAEWREKMINAFTEIHDIFGGDAFRFESSGASRRPINMPLMECLIFMFMSEWHRPQQAVIRDMVDLKKSQWDSSGEFRSRVDSSISVDRRFSDINDLIQRLQTK